ncbi:MAG TPA: DNA-formamidopyrimidine glycosylase family protein [Anaerolineae bacterium]|nr:DNA-formamidopyrimidine glycosylase family protein [Anaerolineae bacterium]
MFELPECLTLARQMNDTLQGKVIRRGELGNSPHKFVWYNRTHEEFGRLTQGKTVGEAQVRGRWLFIPLEPGHVLVLGEFGGQVLYHLPGSKLPKTYHLCLTFADDSFLTATTQMWGAVELYPKGEELETEYVRGVKTTPAEPEFTLAYFSDLLDELAAGKKRSTKSLLTQEQTIPGLGNAIAQDILFRARLHPRHSIAELSADQRSALYEAIAGTVAQVTEQGGRYDEVDLYNNPGGYVRLLDKNAVGRPCPACGGNVEKFQYLGGACYVCPACQE